MFSKIPPRPLSFEEFKKCREEGRDPFDVDGLNTWRKNNEKGRIIICIIILASIMIMFGVAVIKIIS